MEARSAVAARRSPGPRRGPGRSPGKFGVFGEFPRVRDSVQAVHSRLAALAETDEGGGAGAPAPASSTEHAFRRGRRWVGGGYAWIRHSSGEAGFVGGSRFLDGARLRAVHHAPRTACSPTSSLSLIRSIRLQPQSAHRASASRQSGGGGIAQRHGQCVKAHDVGAPSHRADAEELRCAVGREMDPVRGESVRRYTISYMGPGRRSGIASIVAGNSSSISVRRASILPSSTPRGISSTPETDPGSDSELVGRRSGAVVESSGGPHSAGGPEDREGERYRHPRGTILASPSLVRAVARIGRSDPGPRARGRGASPAPRWGGNAPMVRRRRRGQVRDEVIAGIRQAVLGRAGYSTNTSGAEAAAHLLSELTWAESTWSTRATQIARWLRFCDEDMRDALPASEGDVLAYIGYLSLERRISPESLLQYVSAVSRYHELHYLPSPTRTPLVRALVLAYRRAWDLTASVQAMPIGLSAEEVRRIVAHGMRSDSAYDVGCCAATVFAFVFQCRSVSVDHLQWVDVVLTPSGITASLFRRKEKSIRRPLTPTYPANPLGGLPIPLPYSNAGLV